MRLNRWVPRRRPKREPLIRPEDILLSKRITWRIDEPFTIFECREYLPASAYDDLAASFPTELLDATRGASRQSRLTNAMVGFDDFVRSHPVWGDLWNSWRSSAFRKDAFDLLGSEMRGGLLERTGSSVPARMHGAALRSRLVHRVDFDVNYSVRGYRLTPHTDSPKKLLALLLYLPAADRPEVGAGTGFWKRRVGTVVPEDAWWSKGQLPRLVDGYDSSDRVDGVMDRFRAAMEQFHLAEYAPNTLVGFVKTQDSWHDVDLRDFPEGARRRVVLYNINLR